VRRRFGGSGTAMGEHRQQYAQSAARPCVLSRKCVPVEAGRRARVAGGVDPRLQTTGNADWRSRPMLSFFGHPRVETGLIDIHTQIERSVIPWGRSLHPSTGFCTQVFTCNMRCRSGTHARAAEPYPRRHSVVAKSSQPQ
ncbi:unnamed protein product, partial [Pylaiella littoralis]